MESAYSHGLKSWKSIVRGISGVDVPFNYPNHLSKKSSNHVKSPNSKDFPMLVIHFPRISNTFCKVWWLRLGGQCFLQLHHQQPGSGWPGDELPRAASGRGATLAATVGGDGTGAGESSGPGEVGKGYHFLRGGNKNGGGPW